MFTSRLVFLVLLAAILAFGVRAKYAQTQMELVVPNAGTSAGRGTGVKLPKLTVEGTVVGSLCPVLNIRVGNRYIHLMVGGDYVFEFPIGQHLIAFDHCYSLDRTRVRVEYTPETDGRYDGAWHKLYVLEPRRVTSQNSKVPWVRAATKPEASHPAAAKAPQHATAEGNFTAVTCRGWDLSAVFELSGYTLQLHSADYRNVDFYVPGAKPTDEFSPCRELKGHQAKVDYIVVKGKAYGGEISKIEIE